VVAHALEAASHKPQHHRLVVELLLAFAFVLVDYNKIAEWVFFKGDLEGDFEFCFLVFDIFIGDGAFAAEIVFEETLAKRS
jgi:hypothetical protein